MGRNSKGFFSIGLLASLAAVSLAQQHHLAPAPPKNNSTSNVYWRTARRGTESRIDQLSIFVMEDAEQFENYCMKAFGRVLPGVTTGMNFNNEQLIAIHLGKRPNDGYRALVKRIWKGDNGNAEITITEQIPSPYDPVSDYTANPWVIARVTRGAYGYNLKIVKQQPFNSNIQFIPPINGNGNGGGNGNGYGGG